MTAKVALVFLCLASLVSVPKAPAQTKDTRIDKLIADTEQLKTTVADQGKRIAELEKTVKMLQAIVQPKPAPIPSPTAAWSSPNAWNQIKTGMSEAQVVGILGSPTRVESVQDTRKLYYQPDPNSTSTLNGSVTLKDDRVEQMSPPAF